VRDADMSELRSIVSDPKESHMYYIKEFLSLSDITNNLYIDLCNSAKSLDSIRLVNGTSLCSGRLEVKSNQSNQWWSSVCDADFDQQDAEVVCRELGCGAPSVLQGALYGEVEAPMWTKEFQCGGNESALLDCSSSDSARTTCSPGKAVGLTCSGAQCESTAKTDIVLLVDTSGSISDNDFESILVFLADVVRGFDIGPDKFQIGVTLYSDSPETMWNLNTYQNKESLLNAIADLKHTGGNTMIGRALDHINQMSFKPHVGMRVDSRKIAVLITDGESQDDVNLPSQNLKDRGIEIYTIGVRDADMSELRSIASDPKESHMYYIKEFLSLSDITNNLYIDLCNSAKSLDSIRLVNGTSLCSGRLEVKSNQSNQWWSSVCDADFDQQDAEVVCRELGCGAPSVLQGALYGEVEAPMWTREFQCGGNESALLDCSSSDSARTTCSPGKAVGLTCSEPVRLVGGASRCAGTLQVNRGEWRPVDDDGWTLKEAAVACRELDCGSAVSTRRRMESSYSSVWKINTDCVHSGFTLRDCSSSASPSAILEITCS
ncbi:scavenger receptor cysteine-rich type 1 protein M130-like, partial [Seriola dumerili]|uniref:scavenger receptor cysteine-rich type 1 protein M130-like n=1 Tax=Seriola dumerili TaxID=41447 RepID=UPI000BBE5092